MSRGIGSGKRGAALKTTIWVCLAGLAMTLCGLPASATDGNELVGIGAIQRGTAGAGVASPKDATWAWLNPASIVDLERRVDLGLDVLLPQRTTDINGPSWLLNLSDADGDLFLSLANNNANDMADSTAVFSPSLGVILPFKRLTFGWGFYGVQGNNVVYPRARTIPAQRAGGGDRRAELQVFKSPFTFAHRFDNGWSAGIALVGVYSRLRTDSLTLQIQPTEGDFSWDTAYGFGVKVGVYKQWEKWGFGATYLSRQWVEAFDKYEDLMVYNLDQPQQFQIGLAYRPVQRLEFVLDYKFIDWSGIQTYGEDTIKGGLGWNDQHILKAGVTWDATDWLTLRAGISYAESPIPRDAVFSNVLFPAIAKEHYALGFTVKPHPRFHVHAAYVHAPRHTQTESGTGDLFSQGGKGTSTTYEMHSVGMQFSWLF
jgi:long-chain fatty acid transport protein